MHRETDVGYWRSLIVPRLDKLSTKTYENNNYIFLIRQISFGNCEGCFDSIKPQYKKSL